MKKKIFLTGSGGFIGRNIAEQLSESYTICAPRSSELDLLDAQAVRQYLHKETFDIVIHAAVHGSGRNRTSTSRAMIDENIHMFKNLAACSDMFGRMFYFGSGAEFGKQEPIIQVKEEDFGKRMPADDYGKMKYYLQQDLYHYSNIYNLRLFGIFGPYEDFEIRFISNALCRVLFDKDIVIKQNVYFDYLYINDFISLLSQFIELETIPYKDINVCSGERIDLLSLAHMVKKASGKDVDIVVKQKGLQNEYTGNCDRLITLLGLPTLTPLPIAIAYLYAWYDNHKGIIDPQKLGFDA